MRAIILGRLHAARVYSRQAPVPTGSAIASVNNDGKLFPDENLLRGVYRLALPAMLSAVKEFTAELGKLA